MCKYQRVTDNRMPYCTVTKKDCTFCVLGDAKTYLYGKIEKVDTSRVYGVRDTEGTE